jgi:hypothetical protein
VQLQTTTHYDVGSCVLVTPGPAATTVDCSQQGAQRIAAVTDYPRPCPSGTSDVDLVEQQTTLCVTAP